MKIHFYSLTQLICILLHFIIQKISVVLDLFFNYLTDFFFSEIYGNEDNDSEDNDSCNNIKDISKKKERKNNRKRQIKKIVCFIILISCWAVLILSRLSWDNWFSRMICSLGFLGLGWSIILVLYNQTHENFIRILFCRLIHPHRKKFSNLKISLDVNYLTKICASSNFFGYIF